MQRGGFGDENVQKSGLFYVLNYLGDKWSGSTVKTKWKNQRFVPAAGDGHDRSVPNERITSAEGSCEFPAPPGLCGQCAGIA
jgi:alpha-amylase